MANFNIRKAERRKARARIGLIGPAGSGKTFSALKLAAGIGGRICVIDTEQHSAELYAHLCEYDVLILDPPYSPERYIAALAAIADAKYDIVVIDSLSPAWAGVGGVLSIVDNLAAKNSGNSFAQWRYATPKHNNLVDAILSSPLHVIATMRAKTEWVLEEDSKGRKVPRKVGIGAIQRDGMEYEFTLVFELDADHNACATKDRTSIFETFRDRLSEQTGQRISKWLESGVEAPEPVPAPPPTIRKPDVLSIGMNDADILGADVPPPPDYRALIQRAVAEMFGLVRGDGGIDAPGDKQKAAIGGWLKEVCGYPRTAAIPDDKLESAWAAVQAKYGVWKLDSGETP